MDDRIIRGIAGCYKTGEYSDLILRCRGKEFKVHKIIVCTQSSFFKNACSGSSPETTTTKVDLDDNNEELVALMLGFMYHQDSSEIMESDLQAVYGKYGLLVHMYAITTKYRFNALRKVMMAELRGAHGTPFDIDADYVNAVDQTFKISPPNYPLRRLMIEFCTEHISLFVGDDSGCEDEFKDLMGKNLAFAADFAQALADHVHKCKVKEEETLRCPSCKKSWKAVHESFEVSPRRYCPHCGRDITKEDVQEEESAGYAMALDDEEV